MSASQSVQSRNRGLTPWTYVDEWGGEYFHGDFTSTLCFSVCPRRGPESERRNVDWHLDHPDAKRLDLFTDGSGSRARIGGWAVVQACGRATPRLLRSGRYVGDDRPAGWSGSAGRALVIELKAIAEALDGAVAHMRGLLAQGEDPAEHSVVIFCDSDEALASVGNYRLSDHTGVPAERRLAGEWLDLRILANAYELRMLGVRRCSLEPVKGHSDVVPNEAADTVAKAQAGHISWERVRGSRWCPTSLPAEANAAVDAVAEAGPATKTS